MAVRRIGVMGGMFDPVHRGHLEAANVAIRTLDLDALHLIPCAQPNHREPALADAVKRLEMLRLAVAGQPKLKVDDRELRRGGVSYTVDTLLSLAEEFPGAMLVLVLGVDAFASLPGWHQWQGLFALAHILVLNRPGPEVSFNEDLALDLQCRQVPEAERLFTVPQGRILRLDEPKIELSSTQVRECLRRGENVDALLPPAVAEFIREKGLYTAR
ncbi:MAG: nicotinate-nucleotide adenylyltransferase [Pseudomonadales bacterium]|nr:nicotinate-nucleotide adenylyltransferase [Pseudomonadales bacterium]